MAYRKYFPLMAIAIVSLFIFIGTPTSGAWGARWSSGSAIGSGNVSGLKKAKHDGASVNSVVAHPGADFCDKKTHLLLNGCHDADPHAQKKFGTDASASSELAPLTVPAPASTRGLVFCQDQNNPGNIERGPIVNVVANLAGNLFIPASAIDNNGNAPFSIHDAIDLTTLNSQFNANSICPPPAYSFNNRSDLVGFYHHSTPNWTFIDFVPEAFSASLQASDKQGHVITQAVYDCSMPEATLLTLNYHQQIDYTCTIRFNQ